MVGLPIFNFQDLTVRKTQQEIFKNSPHQVITHEIVGFITEKARQIMIDNFLKSDCDYFLNMDADIIPLRDISMGDPCPIDTLIKADKDIVGGIYYFKTPPCQPVYRPLKLQEIYESEGKFPDKWDWKEELNKKELFKVKYLGNGFKLVKREVIKKVREKHQCPNMTMIYNGEYLSEDFAFDLRVGELGFTVWADPSIKLGHEGKYIYTRDDFEKYYGK